MQTQIYGDFVHFPALGAIEILSDYMIVVDEEGHIIHNEPMSSEKSKELRSNSCATVTRYEIPKGSFVIPTFCDLHLHAPQFLYQGTGLHLPLMQWLNEYAFKAEEKIDADPQLAQQVYDRLAHQLLEHGTGAVVLFGTIKSETNLILARTMQSKGIRAYVGKLSMDISSRPTYVEPSAEASLEAARSFSRGCQHLTSDLPVHERLVQPILTPRFVPTCSNAVLYGLGQLAKEDSLWIQSHMAESLDQVQWVKAERGLDDIDVFDKHQLLTPRTIQAHCTFLDTSSLSHVAARGTSIAHCPLSNAYFSAEPFRLREALDNEVKVGLGTDIAGGYSIDIMNCMRQAVAVSKMREGTRALQAAERGTNDDARSLSIDWKESLYLATAGGATAMGLSTGAGTLRVGAPFDAQCITIFDQATERGVGSLEFFESTNATWDLTEEYVEKWWCLGDVRNRKRVWVQGRQVWEADG